MPTYSFHRRDGGLVAANVYAVTADRYIDAAQVAAVWLGVSPQELAANECEEESALRELRWVGHDAGAIPTRHMEVRKRTWNAPWGEWAAWP